MCMVFCLDICFYTLCACSVWGGQKGYMTVWNWSYKPLLAAILVPGNEHWYSTKAASALSYRDISPAPRLEIFIFRNISLFWDPPATLKPQTACGVQREWLLWFSFDFMQQLRQDMDSHVYLVRCPNCMATSAHTWVTWNSLGPGGSTLILVNRSRVLPTSLKSTIPLLIYNIVNTIGKLFCFFSATTLVQLLGFCVSVVQGSKNKLPSSNLSPLCPFPFPSFPYSSIPNPFHLFIHLSPLPPLFHPFFLLISFLFPSQFLPSLFYLLFLLKTSTKLSTESLTISRLRVMKNVN